MYILRHCNSLYGIGQTGCVSIAETGTSKMNVPFSLNWLITVKLTTQSKRSSMYLQQVLKMSSTVKNGPVMFTTSLCRSCPKIY